VTQHLAFIWLIDVDALSIMSLAGMGFGLYLFVQGFQLLARKRLIANTPSSRIRSASLGLVEISGQAIGPYTIPAPITALPCYYYRSIAWQWERRGKSDEWVKVADETLHVPFYLDDNTGRLLVDPRGAEMDIHCDFKEEFSNSIFSAKDLVPPNVSNFLARHGVGCERKVKVEEYCIKPKNALFVLGTLAENPGLDFSENFEGRRMTAGTPYQPHSPLSVDLASSPRVAAAKLTLMRSDAQLPRQEIVRLSSSAPQYSDVSEMTQQQKIAAALSKVSLDSSAVLALGNAAQSTSNWGRRTNSGNSSASALLEEEFDMTPKVLLMQGTNNSAFYISWRSQREVVATLGWRAALYIWGGPALTLICVYLLAAHFNWL
jgi:hypothetical protein